MRNHLLLPLACAAVSLLDTTAATAQDAPATAVSAQPPRAGLEEIIVSARKRTESLQDVPVAVSAISPIQLEGNLATDLNKVAALAPQVAFLLAAAVILFIFARRLARRWEVA